MSTTKEIADVWLTEAASKTVEEIYNFLEDNYYHFKTVCQMVHSPIWWRNPIMKDAVLSLSAQFALGATVGTVLVESDHSSTDRPVTLKINRQALGL